MAYADLAALSAAKKRRYHEVGLPQMFVTVRIQSLTEREYQQYQAVMIPKTHGKTVSISQSQIAAAQRLLIALCLVDDDGNRLIADDAVDQIMDWDAGDVELLKEACWDHCGLPGATPKNLPAITGGDSPIG